MLSCTRPLPWLRRALVGLVLLLGGATSSRADDDGPSAWVEVERLLAVRRSADAVAAAQRAPSSEREALVSYARDAANRSSDDDARRFLGRAESLLEEKEEERWRDALVLLERIVGMRPSVPVLFAHEARGDALARLGSPERSWRAYADAGLAAESIGWMDRALADVREAKAIAQEGGDPTHLRRACEHGLRLAQAVGDASGLASARFDLACACAMDGEFGVAIGEWQSIYADASDAVDPVLRCMISTRLATAYVDLAELPPAEAWLERAGRDLQRVRGMGEDAKRDGDLLEAELERVRGAFEYLVGRFPESARHSRTALASARELEDQELATTSAANHALALARMGRLSEAETVARSVVDQFKTSNDPARRAKAWANLGDCLERAGRFPDASRALEQAIEVLSTSRRTGLRAELRNHLGQVLAAMGRPRDSIEAHEQALSDARAVQSGWETSTAWMGLARAWSELGEHWEALACVRQSSGTLRENARALSSLIAPFSRARWADLARAALVSAVAVGDPDAVLEALDLMRSPWNGAGAEMSDPAPLPSALRRAYDESRERETHAWNELRKARRAATTSPAVLVELERAAVRRTDEADLAAGELRRVRGAAGGPCGVASTESIRARLRSTEAIVFMGSLPSARVLVTVHAGVACLIREDRSDAAGRPPVTDVTACRAWAFGAWQPGSGVRTLLVSPDPAASDLPFAAMFPELDVLLVEGASWLGHHPAAVRAGPLRTAAILADDSGHGRLPGAARESTWLGGESYMGKAATEARFRSLCSRSDPPIDVLHVSCHTRLDPIDPLRTALLLAPDESEDGYVSIREVGELQVQPRLALVVLGGCETAKGVPLDGAGVLALSRAFMAAGAPRVLGSAWPVSDAATGEFLREFYAAFDRARQAGASTPAAFALREAQRAFRTQSQYGKWKDPKYWAAWVLWGLPR